MFTVSYSLLQRYEYFLNYRLTIQYFRLTERVLLVVFPAEGALL